MKGGFILVSQSQVKSKIYNSMRFLHFQFSIVNASIK
jgi:hypothetical protein